MLNIIVPCTQTIVNEDALKRAISGQQPQIYDKSKQAIMFTDKQKSSPIKELLFNQLVKERYKTESVLLDFKSVEVSNTVAVSYNVSISRTLS